MATPSSGLSPDLKKLMKRRENSSVFTSMPKPKFESNVQDLMRRRGVAKGEMLMWFDLLKKAYHYAVPNYNPWDNLGKAGQIVKGENKNADIYDLTLPIAHQKLVNKLLTGMTPQGQQWVKFIPGEAFGPPEDTQYKKALESTQAFTDKWFNILDKSNFYLAQSEALSDVIISTGALTINEGSKKSPLRFEAVPVSQVMLEGDAVGGISAVFRDWENIKVEHIKQVWPEARLPHNKESGQKVNIYECSYIDFDADEKEKFRYTVMTSNREVLFQESAASWPWVIYRMRKLAGEVRGRGPSLEAMPTAATINEAVGDELVAAAFTANPMYMAASDSAFNSDTFEARPGTIIPVQMIMGQTPIQVFPPAGNINFSSLLVEDFRQQIRELLFSAPLGPIDTPGTTATEANIRFNENLESFMAMAPRLQAEFFDIMIPRTLFVINKVVPETFADIDPAIKEKILSIDGEILSLKYETPLMTARGQIKVQALERWYQSLASLVGPEAASASLRATELPQMLGENTGADMKMIKDKEQLDAELEAAAQALIEQQTGEKINVEGIDGKVGTEI